MNKIIVSTIVPLAFGSWSNAAEPPAAPPSQPNILLILTDDLGWGDVHCYNPNGKIPTPNVDRLAREGMMFTHAHTPAALCAPSRYSMLTGNYPWRGRAPYGTWGINVPSQLKPGQQTGASLLRTAGYRTAMFGKAHIGGFFAESATKTPAHQLAPMEWGFDYSFLLPRGHQNAKENAFYENGIRVNLNWDTSQVGERLLEKAAAFLDDDVARNKAAGKPQPFYMHFCTDGAHIPYIPAPLLAGAPIKGATKMNEHTDMIYETDVLTGKLIEMLEKRGLLDTTLIVYTSDNGGLPYERRFGHDSVAGLRGVKGHIFEGGTRVPFVVRWPGKVPAGTVRRQLIGTQDFVATALELAGVRVPATQALDSMSLVPVMLGKQDDTQPVRKSLQVSGSFGDLGCRAAKPGVLSKDDLEPRVDGHVENKKGNTNLGMAHAVYEGDWKLVLNDAGKAAMLYNLTTDLGEEENLIAVPALAGRIKEMEKCYRAIRNSKRSTAIPGTTS